MKFDQLVDFITEAKKKLRLDLRGPVYMVEVRSSIGIYANHFSFYKILNMRQLKRANYGYIDDIVRGNWPVIKREEMGIQSYFSYDLFILVEELKKLFPDRLNKIKEGLTKPKWNQYYSKAPGKPMDDYQIFAAKYRRESMEDIGYEDPHDDTGAL